MFFVNNRLSAKLGATLRATLGAVLLFSTISAQAYYSVMDTGEVMAPSRYKLTPELQFLTEEGGANVGTNLDVGLTEDTAIRGQLGFGTTDFYLGAFFKYMPYPDTDNQPAIGFNVGAIYASDAGDTDFTLRIEPLISKKFVTNFGAITPYGSLPLGIQHRSAQKYYHDHNNIAAQISVGTQVDLKSIPDIGLMAEIGIDLNKAYSYVSFGAAWSFGFEAHKKVD
jgi:hypothetical protein